ncbi:MAG: hypothetical protein M3Y08_01700 [Fibrobacterota bacterium]|nr:hypothetical protein [Fibrobacterota bacterium]
MDTSNPSQPKGRRSGLRDKVVSLGREVYWISISARDDAKPFGSRRGGETVLNDRGKALATSWRELAGLRPSLEADAVIIGPRRIQGLLILSSKSPDAVSLADAVKLFKVLSALRLAQLGKTAEAVRNLSVSGAGAPAGTATRGGKAPAALWKKGFVEKPITGSAELAEARKALKALHAR